MLVRFITRKMSGKPTLSKHRTAFARNKAKKGTAAGSVKSHGYDARNYHQNAHRREIRSLVKFDCPVCRCKGTTIVQFDRKNRIAVVKCGVCLSLDPIPEDLPYPYHTSFVPELENRADVFFRFQEAFFALVKQGAQGEGSNSEDKQSTAAAAALRGDHLLDGVMASFEEADEEEDEADEEEDEGTS